MKPNWPLSSDAKSATSRPPPPRATFLVTPRPRISATAPSRIPKANGRVASRLIPSRRSVRWWKRKLLRPNWTPAFPKRPVAAELEHEAAHLQARRTGEFHFHEPDAAARRREDELL